MNNPKWPETTFVLIPTYRAGAELEKFLPSVISEVPISQICIVDDGSPDNTEEICLKYGVDYLKNEINFGKGNALKKGFYHLLQRGAKWIITMDADGQHSAVDINKFVESAKKHPDSGIIIGKRNISLKSMPIERVFSNKVTSVFLSFFCGIKIADCQCGFRIYSSSFLKKVTIFFNRFEMETEIILKALYLGYDVRFISVHTLYCSSRSNISHIKDTCRWIYAVLKVWLENKIIRKKQERTN